MAAEMLMPCSLHLKHINSASKWKDCLMILLNTMGWVVQLVIQYCHTRHPYRHHGKMTLVPYQKSMDGIFC